MRVYSEISEALEAAAIARAMQFDRPSHQVHVTASPRFSLSVSDAKREHHTDTTSQVFTPNHIIDSLH